MNPFEWLALEKQTGKLFLIIAGISLGHRRKRIIFFSGPDNDRLLDKK
jgi:hypothetical protein